MAKRWYVVHAYSGFENQVARALRERVARASMEERFGEILVPTEEVIEMRGGQKRRSERKFFPGYVLVTIHKDFLKIAEGLALEKKINESMAKDRQQVQRQSTESAVRRAYRSKSRSGRLPAAAQSASAARSKAG